ncbi:hypothetical protein HQ584_12580 [Patescibacteria group bacterium]|nr:hypothetical protein [Patescibacteria group bacterium]
MNEIELAIERAIPRIAIRLQNELKIACPVDKGLLRRSINVRAEGTTLIIWMRDYGEAVEFGRPPRISKAKKNKGKKIKTKGQRPNPFIRGTLLFKFPKIVQEEILRSF